MFEVFEVFNPCDGITKATVPLFLARFLCRIFPVLDYAKPGEGW